MFIATADFNGFSSAPYGNGRVYIFETKDISENII